MIWLVLSSFSIYGNLRSSEQSEVHILYFVFDDRTEYSLTSKMYLDKNTLHCTT
jgi:protocatechuate 3,4-dioxygenase beta subunit